MAAARIALIEMGLLAADAPLTAEEIDPGANDIDF